jgi:hypothetical protein
MYRVFSPFHISSLKGILKEGLRHLEQTARPRTRGKLYAEQLPKIFQAAKRACIFIKDVPGGITCKEGHPTVAREEADMLVLDDEAAAVTLMEGFPDGKRVLVRKSQDRYEQDTEQILQLLERLWDSVLDVQDPMLSSNGDSFCPKPIQSIVHQIREVVSGWKNVGYTSGEVLLYNFLSLPFLRRSGPLCLQMADTTRVH